MRIQGFAYSYSDNDFPSFEHGDVAQAYFKAGWAWSSGKNAP